MFGLFNNKKEKKPVEETKVQLTDEEKSTLNNEIQSLKAVVKEQSGNDKIVTLNNLGSTYEKLDDKNNAIKYYEDSLNEKEQFGDAYNALLKLYEEKRKEAAYQKNDDGIQKYVGKMDDLMSISKRVLKSNY
ncbi:tetratricopeptide repeat protein [Companilactobacillus jidongensis]|uniref:tetratricopeptide repeat protein n=1 Tax=Companilactobacillus jidongensis TaxID=2486006 RepID=UPI000F76CB85|nr:tetratricopeptide repeat protein [Companilactobacillus jidongensis]